jgi:hypothetical protein
MRGLTFVGTDQRGLLVKVYLYIDIQQGKPQWTQNTFVNYELSRIFE